MYNLQSSNLHRVTLKQTSYWLASDTWDTEPKVYDWISNKSLCTLYKMNKTPVKYCMVWDGIQEFYYIYITNSHMAKSDPSFFEWNVCKRMEEILSTEQIRNWTSEPWIFKWSVTFINCLSVTIDKYHANGWDLQLRTNF